MKEQLKHNKFWITYYNFVTRIEQNCVSQWKLYTSRNCDIDIFLYNYIPLIKIRIFELTLQYNK